MLFFQTEHNAIYRFFEVPRFYTAAAPPRREQRRFIDHVSQVGAHHPGSSRRDCLQVHIHGELHSARVHFENCLAALEVRAIQDHLPIKDRPSRPAVD
jgi:hypothetical protein